ncbi:MAG TPA: 3-hydroxyacyl-ACP dehydratase FabZ family protein [Tepidisphaeraceae bacterium]
MALSRPEILDQLKVLLRRDLKLGPDIAIPDDMPFSGTDADFDSLDILLLLSSIERQFKLKIPSEAVGKEVFRNLSTLADYIERHVNTGAKMEDPLSRLPHRDPFRFITRINQLQPGISGEAVWEVNGSEPFFAGHFPGNPLVPGVLIAEAMAQLSGLVGPPSADEGRLVHVDVRFDRPVAPPAQIILRSKHLRSVGILQQFEVSALVGEETVARGMLTLSRPRKGGPPGPGGAL